MGRNVQRLLQTIRLNPDDNSGLGASSSSDGYSMNQDVLVGIQPPSKHADNPVATFYSDIDYKGKAVDLPEGEFCCPYYSHMG